MSTFAPDIIVSGQFADVYLINGASTAFTAAQTDMVTAYTRTQRTFASNTLFRLFDRTKKIWDGFTDVSQFNVYNNAVLVSPTTYKLLGGGYIYFPNGITPAGTAAEVQTLTIGGTPTSANITFTFVNRYGVSSTSAAPLAYTSATTNAQVQTHLQGLTSIGSGNATVTGSAGGPYTIAFAGAYALGPENLITATATFVAGTSPSVTIVEATPGTSGITISGTYIPSAAGQQVHITACKDWKITKNSAIVQADTYGVGFGRDLPGIARGQFDFQQMSIDNTLHFYQVTNTPLTIAFFETISAQAGVAPRIWVCQGYVTQTPVDAPLTGPVMGQVQGTLISWPFFLAENM